MKKIKIKLATILIWLANCLTKKGGSKSLQQLKEIGCIEGGHLWTKYDDPSKKIKDRVYCRRCGQMYHEHTYINTQL